MRRDKAAVFVVATHGEGDPTDNARRFHKWLVDPDRSSADGGGVLFSVRAAP
jgi:NADPH-ferrihemoprotein reductase